MAPQNNDGYNIEEGEELEVREGHAPSPPKNY